MITKTLISLVGLIASVITIWQFTEWRSSSNEPQIVQSRMAPPSVLPGERAKPPAEPPTPVVHFSAEPRSPLKGERTMLTWNVTDADSVVISGIGEVPSTGSREEIVSESHTYELRATNRFNKSAVAQTVVSARDWPTPELSVSVEPNPVIKGHSTTVRWQSEFASSVLIEPFGPVEPSGSRSLDVDQPLVLRARAEGPGGVRDADVTVDALEVVSISIPRGQDIWVRLSQPLGSAVSRSEDAFEAVLQRDLRIGKMKIAAEGSAVWGRIADIETPGRVQGRASIDLVLERLTLLDGSVVEVETDSVRRDKSSFGKDMLRTLVATAAGAAVGASIDGKSGAARGAAVGTGAGIAIDMTERGEDVLIPAGAQMKFKIRKPVAVEMLCVP